MRLLYGDIERVKQQICKAHFLAYKYCLEPARSAMKNEV